MGWVIRTLAAVFPRLTSDRSDRITTDGRTRIFARDGTEWVKETVGSSTWTIQVLASVFPRLTSDRSDRITTDGRTRIYARDGTEWVIENP